MEKVTQIFKEYPNTKQVYVTSDDYVFWKQSDAKEHAKTLEDKTVKAVEKEAKEIAIAEGGSEDGSEGKSGKGKK